MFIEMTTTSKSPLTIFDFWKIGKTSLHLSKSSYTNGVTLFTQEG